MKSLPKDIILFSTADWDNPTWTNNQHMASRLARHGFRVLYIESLGLRKPTTSSRDIARIYRRFIKGLGGLRKVQENVWIHSPLVIPFHSNSTIRRLNRIILSNAIHQHSRRLGFQNPIFWTYNPLTFDLTGAFKESMLIYHCVDNLAASPGLPSKAIIASEEKLVRKADLVFTTHQNLKQHLSRWNPDNTYYLPNVADFNLFSSAQHSGDVPDDLSSIPKPRIGFIGAISDYKVDLECIAYIAQTRKDWHWVMIGQIEEGLSEKALEILRKPNVHFLGAKPYKILPDYLRGIDVAVLPNRINSYTSSMFPMKFFEYLSAGKPVVATDIPALKNYTDVCSIAKNYHAFLEAIDNIFDGNIPDISRRLQVAQENTWDARLNHIKKIVSIKWHQKNGS